MARYLTDLQIDEVSLVDKGAGEGTRVKLLKRDPWAAYYQDIFKGVDASLRRRRRLSYAPDDVRRYGKSGLPPIRKDDDERRRVSVNDLTDDDIAEIVAELGDDAEDGGNAGRDSSAGSRHASALADLIVEANPGTDRVSALDWLRTKEGGALLARTSRHKRLAKNKETNTMTTFDRAEGLRAIVKSSGGLEAFCKSLTVDPSIGASISEVEFTALVTEKGRKLHPGVRPDVAFAKYFSDPDSYVIRAAHAAITSHGAKNYLKSEPLRKYPDLMPTEPVWTGGPNGDTRGSSPGRSNAPPDSGDVADRAYKMLQKLAQKLRETNPALSAEQCFARVMEDRNNAQLASDAVLKSRARMTI